MLTNKLRKLNDNFKQVSDSLNYIYPYDEPLYGKPVNSWSDKIEKFNKKRQPIKINVLSKKPIRFFDYDGKELYSYEKDEFLALSALPELPSHPSLVCQRWNWTLEDAKEYVQEYGRLDIGATYITDDSKTRLYINLLSDGMTVPVVINQTVENSVIVDWGDGTNAETMSGTGYVIFEHIYNEAGSYTISLTVNSGTCTLGYSNSYFNVMGPADTIIPGSLYKVEIGSNVNIGSSTFHKCSSLQSVTIPNSVTSIGAGAFDYCYSLQSVTIPSSVTSIGNYVFLSCDSLQSVTIPSSVTSIGNSAFGHCDSLQSVTIPSSVTSIGMGIFEYCDSLQSVTIPSSVTSIRDNDFYYCYSLQSITIPGSVTSIGAMAFNGCYSLTSITIPGSVTSVGDYAFSSCHSMQYYDFTSHTSIPTLSNTNAFASIKGGCEIRVPSALLNDWVNATNWSNYNDHIVVDYDIIE